MTKHFCNICGNEVDSKEDLVALLTETEDSTSDIIDDAVCPECCNNIKEFIEEQKIRHNVESKIDMNELEDIWVENELIDEF